MELVYFKLCKMLGAAELLLAFRLFRIRRGEYRTTLLTFLLADAVSNLIPLHLRDPVWWRYIWMPLTFLRVGLAYIESFEIGRIPFSSKTKRTEELCLIYAALSAFIIILSSWTWNPENRFQALDTLNQYLRLGAFTGFTVFWSWARMTAPYWKDTKLRTRWHALIWIAWLFTMFVTSTKAKSGLLWLFATWKGGYWLWLDIGVSCLVIQLLLVGLSAFNES